MPPLVAHRNLPDGIYRIHSFLYPDLFLDQPLENDWPVTVSPQGGVTSRSQLWEIARHRTENKYTISNFGNSRALGIRIDPDIPGESALSTARFAQRLHWTVEPRHEAFVIGISSDERVIGLTDDGSRLCLSNINGSRSQRWTLDIVSLRSPDHIDLNKTYLIKNLATGKSLLVRSPYGSYPLHITSYSDPSMSTPDYLKWRLQRRQDGSIALRNVRFGALWATNHFQIGTEPTGYRFIPVATGPYYYICPDMTSSPPRVAQDSAVVDLDTAMPTAVLEERNPFQMWELMPL